MKTNKLIHFFVGISLVCFAPTLKAQNYVQDISGNPIKAITFSDVQGTPFLVDAWYPGSVRLANGNSYKENLFLKYNIKQDELYFKGKNDETLAFVDPVVEFTIDYKLDHLHYKNGFNGINGFTNTTFFQVLADGNVQLLKKITKTILEDRPYNSPTVNKVFADVEQYFLIVGGKPVTIKKDKKAILAAIGNKQAELETYIKANNLNVKNDNDAAKLVIYYNSL